MQPNGKVNVLFVFPLDQDCAAVPQYTFTTKLMPSA